MNDPKAAEAIHENNKFIVSKMTFIIETTADKFHDKIAFNISGNKTWQRRTDRDPTWTLGATP